MIGRMPDPRTFFMEMPEPEALLVFDARNADATGEYEVYALPPSEKSRLWADWEAIRDELTPTGRIPASDVDRDQENHVIRIRTLGLERFART
jgi:hypothetical protein